MPAEAPTAPATPSSPGAGSFAPGGTGQEIQLGGGPQGGDSPDSGGDDVFSALETAADGGEGEPEPAESSGQFKLPTPDTQPEPEQQEEEVEDEGEADPEKPEVEDKDKTETDEKEESEDDDFLGLKSDKDETEQKPEKKTGIENLRQQHEKNKQEIATLTKAIESKESRIKELERELAATDYTKSPEFKDQYEKPLQEAVDSLSQRVSTWTAEGDDGELRKFDYNRDFSPLLNTRDDGQAFRYAKQTFGELAPMAMQERNNILQLHNKMQGAAKDFASKADSYRQQQQLQQIQAKEQAKKTIQGVRESIRENNKGVYEFKDDSLKSLFQKSEDFVNNTLWPEEGTPSGVVARNFAQLAERAAIAPVLQRRVASLQKEIEALSKYRKQAPGSGEGHRDRGRAPKDTDPVELLDQYADK